MNALYHIIDPGKSIYTGKYRYKQRKQDRQQKKVAQKLFFLYDQIQKRCNGI